MSCEGSPLAELANCASPMVPPAPGTLTTWTLPVPEPVPLSRSPDLKVPFVPSKPPCIPMFPPVGKALAGERTPDGRLVTSGGVCGVPPKPGGELVIGELRSSRA